MCHGEEKKYLIEFYYLSIILLLNFFSLSFLAGKIFHSPNHKKVSFFRHIKEMSISTSLRGVDFDYWTSATMAKGILLTIKGNFVFSGKYNMKLIDLQDGLTRR